MHDTKLLSDEMESAALNSPMATIRSVEHTTRRANLWTVIGFCVFGIICSLFVPASYLHIEQTAALLAQAPLS